MFTNMYDYKISQMQVNMRYMDPIGFFWGLGIYSALQRIMAYNHHSQPAQNEFQVAFCWPSDGSLSVFWNRSVVESELGRWQQKTL